MSVWWALFFMGLGGAIVGFFNAVAWKKYYEGRDEWRENESNTELSETRRDVKSATAARRERRDATAHARNI